MATWHHSYLVDSGSIFSGKAAKEASKSNISQDIIRVTRSDRSLFQNIKIKIIISIRNLRNEEAFLMMIIPLVTPTSGCFLNTSSSGGDNISI